MRVKVDYRSGSRQAYKRFCDKFPNVNVPFSTWKKVIYTFNYAFRDYLLDSGDRARLPWGLGSFAISKKKIRKFKNYDGKEYVNLPIDWKKTRAAGKRIYNLNSHTDGCRYKWFWFSRDARIHMAMIWNFKPARSTSRKLAEYLNKPGSKYPQIYKQWK